MKKLGWALFALVFALCASVGVQRVTAWIHGVPAASMPLLVAGTLAPTAQTPLMPSASTWGPSCGGSGDAALDAAWGAGCNTGTQLCNAPTALAPLQTCQPPQMLVVTGGTGNGTDSTITYTSYAHYAYTPGTPFVISGATQANWNTPRIGVNSYSVSGSSPNFLITLGCMTSAPQPTFGNSCANFVPGQPFYVGSINGTFQAGGSLAGTTSRTGINATYVNLPITSTSGAGIGGKVNITTNTAGTVNGMSWAVRGTGYADGDTVTGLDTSGAPYMGTLTGFSATLQNTTVTSPNGPWTVAGSPNAPTASSVTFSTGTHQVIGSYGALNSLGMNGMVQQPWVVSSSTCNIGGVPEHCSVTFANPYSCASSCVSSSTQIAAGQFDDVIAAWDFGEQVPYSLQNTNGISCVIAKKLDPIFGVGFSLDGGPVAMVKTSITSPWGSGKSGVDTSMVKDYCAHFDPTTVSDGLHEIRAFIYPTVGMASCLCAVQAVDGTNSSTFFTAHTHGYQSFKVVGVTNSFDAGNGGVNGGHFQNYDWRYNTGNITTLSGVSGGSSSGTGLSTDTFTLNFTQPANIPAFHQGQTVRIGATTNESCPIETATASGSVLTLNYGGGCNFPAGSEVFLSGVPVTGGNGDQWSSIANQPVIVATGDGSSSITLPSISTASLTYTYTTFAGSGAAAVATTYSNVPISITSGSGTGGSVNVTTNASGVVTNVVRNVAGTGYLAGDTITGLNTTGFAGLSGLTGFSATVFSGTIAANWSGPCLISAASSGSITCPQPFNKATAIVGTATISAQGNLMCVVGGAGDYPAPYDPAGLTGFPGSFRLQLFPDSFQLEPMTDTNCSYALNATGCATATCGPTPDPPSAQTAETIWLTRKDAGTDERAQDTLSAFGNYNGSLFLNANAHGTMKAQDAYVDSWQQTAGSTACRGVIHSSGAALVAYTNPYCGDLASAYNSLTPTANAATQSVGGGGGSCLTFTNANNAGAVPFFIGEPVETTGAFVDQTAASTDSNGNATPSLSVNGVYWIVGLSGNAISLATRPGGNCLTESTAGITGTVQLTVDRGQDSLLLACDTTNIPGTQAPCSASNPETYVNLFQRGVGVNSCCAKSGWFSIAPDTAAGSTYPAASNTVGLAPGGGGWFSPNISQGGHLRVAVDTFQPALDLPTAVPITATPGITTVTGGSLVAPSGSLPGGHTCGATQCETLTFTAPANGALFQAPTPTGGIGQGIFPSGILGTGGTWSCGSAAAPCRVIDSTTTSVSFVNGAASGTWSSGGTQRIVPITLIAEFAGGTFAYDAGSNPQGACGISHISFNTAGAKACMGINTISGVTQATGTNSTAWPITLLPGSSNTMSVLNTMNCLPTSAAQTTQGGSFVLPVAQTIGSASLPYIPAAFSGSTDDVMELSWANAGTFGLRAENDCVGDMLFANGEFSLAGNLFGFAETATDTWSDNRDIIGSGYGMWRKTGADATDLKNLVNGFTFVTNSASIDAPVALADHASYAWGDQTLFTTGTCGNASVNLVSISCVAGPMSIPNATFGGANLDGTIDGAFWQRLTQDITSGDTTFHVPPGSLPGSMTEGWIVYIDCNARDLPMMTFTNNLGPQQNNILNGIGVTAYDDVNGTFSSVTGATASCPVASSPVVVFYNVNHIDGFFYNTGETVAPLLSGSPWVTVSNTIYENVQCLYCVQMQQIFIAGGQYFNVAFDNSKFYSAHAPTLGGGGAYSTERAYGTSGYNQDNFLISNSKLWGTTAIVNFSNSPQNNTYFINDDAGLWPNYPIGAGPFFPRYGGFNQLSVTSQFSTPIDASPTIAVSPEWNIYPTFTRDVDATGAPIGGGLPGPLNLGLLPWYGPQGDPGNGSD